MNKLYNKINYMINLKIRKEVKNIMKTGFTLIELLAVIIILAIIALIATPIILNIINDAKKESQQSSVELYARAVKNGMIAYQVKEGKKFAIGKYTSADLYFMEYNGNVECDVVEYYEDGSIYIDRCKVDDIEVDYTYGTKQVIQIYKPQYYSYDLKGTIGSTEVPPDPSNVPPAGKNYYLGYDVIDGVVSAAYVCFMKNEAEYCLKGYDKEVFAKNTDIIRDAYSEVVDTTSCALKEDNFYCSSSGLRARAYSVGTVTVGINNGSSDCNVYGNGTFRCNE